ncbi:hybrid sensor histidine kinase/response regulator [Geomonas ferrireducens]|uniref:hybrid sensor histidine kinase/response regulator n=1 Tax=Geomonas ferrireducens TaxID=2570227 RepID=UPI0010A8BCBD|nr:response regulator [Geomonas ferrireducens]
MTEKTAMILIVDDTPANLQLLESILKEKGYEVRGAINGSMALKAARLQPPDLVMLDINMPEMNGFEVCRALKGDPALASIPVIFVSAAVETADKLRAFDEGGVDYVTKPFQAQEVLARVETHLELSRVRGELQRQNAELARTLENLTRAQVHLVQSEKMAALGLLTAGVAHELNNPLNFIAASVQGLKKTVAPIDELMALCQALPGGVCDEVTGRIETWCRDNELGELRESMNELVNNACYGANRAAEIVSSLRIFSRMDEAERKSVNLHECLDAALLLLHGSYKDRIRIERHYDDLPPWLCQPGRLNQVFMNLLANAVDAILAKPEKVDETIRVSTRMEERDGRCCAVVEIADSGTGMTDAVLTHLFEPFFTTKEVGKGVGLGLSISHGIVRDHQGVIEVESRAGQGSAFRVILPQLET